MEGMEKKSHILRLAVFLIILGSFGLAGLMLYYLDPNKSSLYPFCVFHRLTGLYCPGCGALRALHDLVHGDIWGAIKMNSLFILSLPLMGYLVYQCHILPPEKRIQIHEVLSARAVWLIFWVILGFWILRNIPIFPLTLLAPH